MAQGLFTVIGAANGDEESIQAVIDTSKAIAVLMDPYVLIEVINGAGQAQRERIAKAYENGDVFELGLASGEVLSNLVGVGTIKNTEKIAEAIAIAEKIGFKNQEIVAALAKRSDINEVIQVPVGSKGSWDKSINGPLSSNSAYVLDNGHAYLTDDLGRVKEVSGGLDLVMMDRNRYQQCQTGKCGSAGDEGGHLIAASLGGAGDKINLVPQAKTLNREVWKDMERFFSPEIQAGKAVDVKINVGYPDSGSRPN